jgi:mannose-1-phosphate guanylyltransferase
MVAPALLGIVLAGGSGNRFWPLSRRDRPKQLLPFAGGASLLRRTVDRLEPLVPKETLFVSTTLELRDAIARELPELPRERILAEPEGRNTGPAIAWALARLPPELSSQPVAILPADHWVDDAAAFRAALASAAATAAQRRVVVTLGVPPARAETGFGYLEVDTLPETPVAVPVRRFYEKPDEETAHRFWSGGRHLWNSGVFVFLPEVFWSQLERHQPAIARMASALRGGIGEEAAAELYAELTSVSIDQGVMERLGFGEVWTVPLRCGWSDLGSWEALATVLAPDRAGNRSRGDVVAVDSEDNLLFADAGTVAVLGIRGLAVVRSGDSVLVLPLERSQEVRRIVAELGRAGRRDLL